MSAMLLSTMPQEGLDHQQRDSAGTGSSNSSSSVAVAVAVKFSESCNFLAAWEVLSREQEAPHAEQPAVEWEAVPLLHSVHGALPITGTGERCDGEREGEEALVVGAGGNVFRVLEELGVIAASELMLLDMADIRQLSSCMKVVAARKFLSALELEVSLFMPAAGTAGDGGGGGGGAAASQTTEEEEDATTLISAEGSKTEGAWSILTTNSTDQEVVRRELHALGAFVHTDLQFLTKREVARLVKNSDLFKKVHCQKILIALGIVLVKK